MSNANSKTPNEINTALLARRLAVLIALGRCRPNPRRHNPPYPLVSALLPL